MSFRVVCEEQVLILGISLDPLFKLMVVNKVVVVFCAEVFRLVA